MSVKLLSWNVRGLNRLGQYGFISVICFVLGRLILCVCKRLNSSGLLEELFEAIGVVLILISCT